MKLDKRTLTHQQAALAAFLNLSMELKDIGYLLELYDDIARETSGSRDPHREVLKRAGVILAVTAWETLIEDVLTAKFEERLEQAQTPDDVRSTFNLAADRWLPESPKRPKPPTLDQWTGTRWKLLVREKFQSDVAGLNTPSSTNIRELFKRYLEVDITASWKWKGVSSHIACQKLDRLIELRGSLAHRGKDHFFENRARVLRRQFVDAVVLVEHLAYCTGEALKMSISDIKIMFPKIS
jgi:hypothetical protein